MKKPGFSALALVGFAALLAGGCPWIGSFDGTSGGTQGLSSGGMNDDGAGGSGGRDDGVSFIDSLSEVFPDCTEPSRGDAWRDEVLLLVNLQRAARGLDPLRRNPTLEDQATEYACEMIQYRFFDHVNPVTGSDLAERAADFAYDFVIIGENLAAGQRSPSEVVEAWMESEGHRANILHPEFTELGVGVRTGGEYGTYWVQVFGRPRE